MLSLQCANTLSPPLLSTLISGETYLCNFVLYDDKANPLPLRTQYACELIDPLFPPRDDILSLTIVLSFTPVVGLLAKTSLLIH